MIGDVAGGGFPITTKTLNRLGVCVWAVAKVDHIANERSNIGQSQRDAYGGMRGIEIRHNHRSPQVILHIAHFKGLALRQADI